MVTPPVAPGRWMESIAEADASVRKIRGLLRHTKRVVHSVASLRYGPDSPFDDPWRMKSTMASATSSGLSA